MFDLVPRYRAFVRAVPVAVGCLVTSALGVEADRLPQDLTPRGPSFALPANLVIDAWVTEVSADSLSSYVNRMVAFGTRNTASDTLSATAGVGAARNWLHDRFADFGGANAEAGFFDYNSTVCGVFGPHRNVTLTKTGTLTPERNFLMLGHLDSRTTNVCDIVSPSPGANDDASGVAALMEMARILSDETFESTMVLVGTTGEEQGLFGATQQAVAAVAEGTRIDAVLNNDIIGNIMGCADPSCPSGAPDMIDSTSVRLFSTAPDFSISRQLTRSQVLQQLRYMPDHTITLIPLQDRPGRGGDHLPFAFRGFAASRFTEAFEFGDGSGNGWQHNGFDVVMNMNFDYLARNVQLNLACFANYLLAPESPNPPALDNLGNGDLRVTWNSVLTAPDVAGYRVAFRFQGDLFYFDVRDAGLDPGLQQTEDFSGLPQDETLFVSVSAYDSDFNESVFSFEQSTTVVVGVEEETPVLPDGLGFREVGPLGVGSTRFALELPRPAAVRVDVFDVRGRLVRTLVDDARRNPGASVVRWDGSDAAGRSARPGVYLVKLSLDGRTAVTLKTVHVE